MIHNMFDKTYAEVREKQSESAKNASSETRRKQSEAMSGEKNPNYGKVFSADYRKNISDGMKKKWAERKNQCTM